MVYKLNIIHKKYYNTNKIELVNYELIETDQTAAYDYDRGTDWKENEQGDGLLLTEWLPILKIY